MKPNEPRRLREIDPDCRDLLEVAAGYRVAPAVRSRLLGRLLSDVAVTSALTGSARPTTASAPTTATATAVPTTAKAWLAGIGLLVVGVVTIVTLTRFWPAAPPQPVPTSSAVVVSLPAPPPPVAPTRAAPAFATPGSASADPSAGSFTTASATKNPVRRLSLAEELLLLDRATMAVRRSDHAGALAALARYRRVFPQGVLREEAEVIEIEALAASGRLSEAHTKAAAFLHVRPHGVLSAKVRTLDAMTNR